MAAIAAITINDGQATPVAHTFNPVETTPIPLYRENGAAGVPLAGQSDISISLRPGSGAEGISKALVKLRLPVLETVSGSTVGGYTPSPRVAYFMDAKIELMLPSRSTSAQRKDLRVLVANLLANAQVVAVVDNLEKPY